MRMNHDTAYGISGQSSESAVESCAGVLRACTSCGLWNPSLLPETQCDLHEISEPSSLQLAAAASRAASPHSAMNNYYLPYLKSWGPNGAPNAPNQAGLMAISVTVNSGH